MRSVGLDSECKTDMKTVKNSCPKLMLGKHHLQTLPFPEGTASMFWKDQPVGGAWTGQTRCGSLGFVFKYFIIL